MLDTNLYVLYVSYWLFLHVWKTLCNQRNMTGHNTDMIRHTNVVPVLPLCHVSFTQGDLKVWCGNVPRVSHNHRPPSVWGVTSVDMTDIPHDKNIWWQLFIQVTKPSSSLHYTPHWLCLCIFCLLRYLRLCYSRSSISVDMLNIHPCLNLIHY